MSNVSDIKDKKIQIEIRQSIEDNNPSAKTVLSRLRQVTREVEVGLEPTNKCVIILLDDLMDNYHVVPYSAGMRPAEAAFLCELSKDLFKQLLLR